MIMQHNQQQLIMLYLGCCDLKLLNYGTGTPMADVVTRTLSFLGLRMKFKTHFLSDNVWRLDFSPL